MALLDEILTPIPGANPAGENLRYNPVYDKIKEARREDDDAPQGEWKRERKLADWALAARLLTEALSKKSKDLQLAAWLTEALIRRNGMAGLNEGLKLTQSLVETFWDNLYPEIEDGDVEFRAAPLQWIGDKLDTAVRAAPMTKSGLDFNKYRESRAVGTEQETADDEAKAAARREAIAEGKITAEEFDAAFTSTPKAWYVQLVAACDAALENIRSLTEVCDAKFGDVAPSFGRLQTTVGEIRQSAFILLQKKRELEPDPVEPVAAETSDGEHAASGGATGQAGGTRTVGEEPANREDAVAWVVAAARYLRRHQPEDPAPYLMLRGLRWGELRAGGRGLDATLLDPPPTEVRQQLKRFSLQSQWPELLESAESAMGKPYGRGWLDIQRYVCRAAAELGRAAIAEAVKSQLRTLLAELPGLPQMTLMDDTASASADTLTWLRGLGPAPEGGLPPSEEEAPMETAVPGAPDIFEMAKRAVNDGRAQAGLEMLARAQARERSGRGRFQRKVQMAELCLTIGKDAIAFPLLNDLAAEIEQRKLEEWESPDAVAHTLALLFRCLEKMETGADEKQRLYERICRLDPAQAMSCTL